MRIFPSAPNHQIIFSIDGRTDDLAGQSLQSIGPSTGYFNRPDNDSIEQPDVPFGGDIEEYNLKYTLEYKYTF